MTPTRILTVPVNRPEWSLEDTKTLHRALFNAIYELADEEQAAENQEPSPPPDEETLGKPPVENMKLPRPTGAKSPTT